MFSGGIASNTGLKRVKAQSQWVKLWGTFICKQWGAPCPGLFIFTRWYLCKWNPLSDNRRIVCVGLTIFWGLALKEMIFVMIMLWNNMLQPTPFLCFKVEMPMVNNAYLDQVLKKINEEFNVFWKPLRFYYVTSSVRNDIYWDARSLEEP